MIHQFNLVVEHKNGHVSKFKTNYKGACEALTEWIKGGKWFKVPESCNYFIERDSILDIKITPAK